MASNGYLPTLVFSPEQQGLNRVPKDSQHPLPIHGLRDDLIRSSPLNMGPQQSVGPWKPISELFDNKQFVRIDQTITKPALIDIQDCCPNSTVFNVKFPMSGLIELEKDGLDLLSFSDITGLQTMKTDYKPYVHDIVNMENQLTYQNLELDSRKPLIDFVGDLVRNSDITIHEDGQVSLAGTRTDVKDMLSILAEFYLSKSTTNWRKSLVPQFNRLDYDATSYYGSALDLENVIVAPPKSPEKVKLKSTTKKKGARQNTKVKHRSNHFQACESLLSIIVDKNRNVKSAIPMLKKSGPELPNLLTQFSASIAGTGIAVLFSVVCKVASGRVPFCSSKLLNTGLGLGLVWLSWAVNRLRDTIVMISRSSNKKKGVKEGEMMKKLDRNVKEIYFRGAALMAVMVLRLA
ncbi:hypothetical protein HanRHA438_Chr11g0510601 [Helianthus annuus]|uniref:Uncharacterized protein n=1 Tax=Helianthus annuus TaxID=4232 RepID=A0A251VII3_HELAN|nr:uncharacterized protein LOC110920403 [Helianthus annuus]KAF5782602.1 hypothetical protein HanXRQr2_Chr11g0497921 [Helianthus annuus]KAJ0502074.1 hypothetical protein HanHA300_Chr11g0408521 [Helianthus annuus]KAJ0510040.1 hypothetical protein HanIR_Chr11g0536111 [Helianthus annuus]KAJ0517998.1 hypothetical protein HanHA89_Chr11g0432221 [Helianthus annuus]KAJ0686018.1 hypothetical protein HanLR1_Chr11g0409761 [Helianthus annuus]